MSFVCPFCNSDNFPRNTGSLICTNCEGIRDLVREVHPEARESLRHAWYDVLELHKMYGFVRERLEEEESVIWMAYWNMERTAVCIEMFKRINGKCGFQCFMLPKELVKEFIQNPPWEDFFEGSGLEDEEKHDLIERLTELMQHDVEAWQSG